MGFLEACASLKSLSSKAYGDFQGIGDVEKNLPVAEERRQRPQSLQAEEGEVLGLAQVAGVGA